MKQQILNLKKKLLLIELPEGAKDIKISTLGDIIFKTSGTKEVVWLADDRVVRKCIGKLTDITERQYKQWVDKFNNVAYRNYKDEYSFYPDFDTDNFFLTAKESFFSYLEKEGILFSNPLDWEKKAYLFKGSENSWGHDDLERWQEAESKVWQLSQTYLFQILK